MSRRTSGDISNAIEIPNLNNLEVVDDEEEVFEGSELDSAADETQPQEVMISCIQTISGDCSLISLWLIL